jgi:iron complex transport system ATP-binding protein
VNRVSFSLHENQWLMLVGPNGAGKSTIVNAVSQGAPYTGSITSKGRELAKMKPAQLARRLGVLSQARFVAYAFSVGEIVKLGRYAYSTGIFSAPGGEEEVSVQNALDITGMRPFEKQSVLTLSGGELQRTFLAQVFAQDPEVLILDEPTNHLDLAYQKQVFALIGAWAKKPGKAVISVVHDLSLARAFGTDVLLLDKGSVCSMGKPGHVLTRENLEKVYAMDVYAWMRDMLSNWKD